MITGYTQNSLYGIIKDDTDVIPFANVYLQNTDLGSASDVNGYYKIENLQEGTYRLVVSSVGYKTYFKNFKIRPGENLQMNITLSPTSESLDEVVVTGTLKPVSR